MRQGQRSLIKLAVLVAASLGLGGVHLWLVKILPVKALNPGVSFGVDLPMQEYIIIALLLAGSFYWICRLSSWALGVVAIGGWVNIMDRILYGYVHDYWKIPFVNLYNNLADWIIFAGIMLLLADIIKEVYAGRNTKIY